MRLVPPHQDGARPRVTPPKVVAVADDGALVTMQANVATGRPQQAPVTLLLVLDAEMVNHFTRSSP